MTGTRNAWVRRIVVLLTVVTLCCLSGCSTGGSPTTIYNEDTEGTTRRTQESVLSQVEAAYQEIGCPVFNPDVPTCKGMFVEFLEKLEGSEQGLTFAMDTIAASFVGYNVELLTPLDAWGQRMRLYIEPVEEDSDSYILIISSAGKDGEVDFLGTYDLTSGNANDDVFTSKTGSASTVD